jgi:hypothetical protein
MLFHIFFSFKAHAVLDPCKQAKIQSSGSARTKKIVDDGICKKNISWFILSWMGGPAGAATNVSCSFCPAGTYLTGSGLNAMLPSFCVLLAV